MLVAVLVAEISLCRKYRRIKKTHFDNIIILSFNKTKQTYGCSVIGVDLSTNMVSIAYERLMGLTASKLKV